MIRYVEITSLLTVILNYYHCSFYLKKKERGNYSRLIVVLLNVLPIVLASLLKYSLDEKVYYSLLCFVGFFYLPFIIYIFDNLIGQAAFIFMFVVAVTSLSSCLNILLVNIIDKNIMNNFYFMEVSRLVINIAFVFICYFTVKKQIEIFLNYTEFKLSFISVIACFNLIVSLFMNNYFLEIKELELISINIGLFFLVVLGSIIMLKTYMSITIMSYRLKEKEKANIRTLDIHMHYYNEINNMVENLRVERHDVKHIIAVIKTLVNEGKDKEILEIVDEYKKNIEDIKFRRYCLNDIINASLSYYFSIADTLGIKYKYNINVTEKIEINSSDLTSIIGNILENAINASKGVDEGRFIDIIIKVHKGNLVIKCLNKYNGNNGEHGEGLGLQSIEETCHKYRGYITIIKENNIFNITALLLISGE